jgi:TrmH family RNA methyltransferase
VHSDGGRHDITSTANPRVKALTRLRRRRHRDEAGVTLVEGLEELTLALRAGVVPSTVYCCPELVAGDEWDAVSGLPAFAEAELVRVNRIVFEKISYRESPDGWLAVLPSVGTELGELRLGPDPLLLVCAGVEKPGNLGAMLRTADAAGVAAVIAADPGTDWSNPNVVRASKGAVYTVPVAAAGEQQVLEWLAERRIPVVATTPDAHADYTELDLRGPLAIAVGAEDVGLSQAWLNSAHQRALIPMSGRVDSLNVSAAAAVLLYEAVRQRRGRAGAQPSRPGG